MKSKSLRKSLATSVIFVDITEMCVKEICQGWEPVAHMHQVVLRINTLGMCMCLCAAIF